MSIIATQEVLILDSTWNTAFYLGLWEALPDANGYNGVEIGQGTPSPGYARIPILGTDWQAAAAGATGYASGKRGPKGGVTWAFPTCTAAWGPIAGWGLFTSTAAYNPVGGTPAHSWGDLKNAPLITQAGSVVGFDSSHQIIIECGSEDDIFT